MAKYIGTVYIVRLGDVVKIGVTTFLAARLKQLAIQTKAAPQLLRTFEETDVIRPRQIEGELHRRFSHLRIHGEWYRAEPELLDWAVENP